MGGRSGQSIGGGGAGINSVRQAKLNLFSITEDKHWTDSGDLNVGRFPELEGILNKNGYEIATPKDGDGKSFLNTRAIEGFSAAGKGFRPDTTEILFKKKLPDFTKQEQDKGQTRRISYWHQKR